MPKELIATVRLLSGLPLFRRLPRTAITRIARGSAVVDAARGTVLYRRGDPSTGFHIVISGQIKLALQTADGHEKVIELIGPGGSLGEAAMFLDRSHPVTAVALSNSRLLHIATDAVFGELDRDAPFARRMIANLSRRLHQFIGELEAVSLRTGTERVIGFLAQQVPDRNGANSCVTTLPASKGIIASQLNLTQEHFSRILHVLSAAGLIRVAGRRIRILDLARLLAYEA